MRLLRALSLDILAGAACGGLLAEHVTQAHMRPAWWVALLTAVWSVYTGDHLLDARRIAGPLFTERHQFHRRHERSLTVALVAAVLTGLAAALTLRPPVRLFGVGLSVAVVVYLASAQRLILPTLPKEPVAGVLYAAGIWGGPLLVGGNPTVWPFVAASLHAAAAVLNLTTVGVFEAEVDRKHGSRSLALRWGSPSVRRWVIVGSCAFAAIAFGVAALADPATRLAFAVLGVQAGLPALIVACRSWFQSGARYRIWGDGVFLLGALPRLLT